MPAIFRLCNIHAQDTRQDVFDAIYPIAQACPACITDEDI